ncbi:MAG TPA: DUF4214 domain-containing protein [Pyrinomonadaceae bacterium]|nr:DUF4214 domain-containing protein [Pyrinomonadaceae bacterium]
MLNFRHIIRLAAVLVFLALPHSTFAVISLVQKTEAAPQATATNVVSSSATYPAPPTTGNLLVAIVAGDVTGTITAPAGWSTAISEAFTSEVDGAQTFQIPSQAIFYKIAGPAEAQLVSFQYLSDPDANVGIQLYEYSGIAVVSTLSGATSSFGHLDSDGGTAGFQVSSGALFPTTAPALLLAGFASRPLDAAPVVNGGTGNANFNAYTNSFAEQSNMSTGEVPCDTVDSGCYGIVGLDRITNALGSVSASATLSPTQGGWRGQIVAFRSAAPTASPSRITGRILDNHGNPLAGAVVHLSGAQNRTVITDSSGNYVFENVQTNGFYTLSPSRLNYSFVPAERSFSQQGSTTQAMFTGVAGAASNPLTMPEFFVRQHYLDFLGREPDEDGFNFWSNQILGCGADTDCVERRTINVSAAYFRSIEFQETGGLVDGLYRAGFGRAPVYSEFVPDTAIVGQDFIVGATNWEGKLEANKQAFVAAFVQRAEFRAAFDQLSDVRYVDELIGHTGVSFSQSERAELLNGLESGRLTRAAVLRQIVENDAVRRARFNKAFVMMEYFGYLRRDPDEAGYRFWLNKLNEFDGNFERAEMVKAFITSAEYRNRFPR